ncbi:carbohydrate porin [Solimicrobium silvestre]|uniref:Carbohydrate-selective porin, OprB family n=1 Tax=Solimicrobium silvestre TaxID=2099400 RepID=A0A2S9H4X2_9BURK|nr:carbohydrate porin [Solimicrobium silvestre]PRC94926.1 Carbohydrate-selective porin, OprB family [Solimicrobium silvestre]
MFTRPHRSNSLIANTRFKQTPLARLLACIGGIASLAVLVTPEAAYSAPPPISIAAGPSDGSTPQSSGFFGFMDGIDRSSNLLGDMWGLRTDLSKYGMTLSVQETSESLGNVTGGTQKGFNYDGLTQAVLQLNTQRAFGLYGGLLNISALQIHGQNVSANNLQTLQTASGIEADRGFRLWEMWYDQKFLDEDRLDVKIGQQSVDQEFIVSSNALMFVNTMFGWPMLPSADMPGGGPAYPLSALGARISARPVNGLTILAGVFNGSPVGNKPGDPEQQNQHGVNFPLGNGTLSMVELQFAYPALGSMVQADETPPLGWTYRVGAWYNSEMFNDQRFDQNGLSLSNPNSNQVAAQHHGNFSYYAVADHLIWRDATELNRTVALFARVMATPLTDRNLVDGSLNAGIVLHCPFAYRTDDTLGFGVGYAHVSKQASALDRDTNYYSSTNMPVRSGEKFAELTYQYQVKPWLQLQPDIQYVVNPGGGVTNPDNPNNPSQRIKNELVLGLRTNIAF